MGVGVARRRVPFRDLLGDRIELANLAHALHFREPDVALRIRTNGVRGAPRRSRIRDHLAGFGIQFADRAFVDFSGVYMPVLGLRDPVWTRHAMPEIRIRKNEGLETAGVI